MGRGTCGKSTWLQHEQFLSVEPGTIEQGQRYARCLPGARRGSQQGIPTFRQRAAKDRQHIFYWESGHDRFGAHELVRLIHECRREVFED